MWAPKRSTRCEIKSNICAMYPRALKCARMFLAHAHKLAARVYNCVCLCAMMYTSCKYTSVYADMYNTTKHIRLCQMLKANTETHARTQSQTSPHHRTMTVASTVIRSRRCRCRRIYFQLCALARLLLLALNVGVEYCAHARQVLVCARTREQRTEHKYS